jgi:hypothetical protein
VCGRYTHLLLTWGELVEFSRLGEGPGPPEPAEFKKRYNQRRQRRRPWCGLRMAAAN